MGSGMPASVTFLLGVWKWVQASCYWNGENIATVEAEAVLLSSLSWKRFPSLVALLDGLKACFAAESLLHGSGSSGSNGGQSQNASGNRSSVGNKPLANGTLHTPMV